MYVYEDCLPYALHLCVCVPSQTNVIEAAPDANRDTEREWYYSNKDREREGPFSFREVSLVVPYSGKEALYGRGHYHI